MNPYNTFWRRLGAYLLDALVLAPVFIIVAGAAYLAQGEDQDPRIIGVTSFVVPAYRVVMHRLWGATAGKMATGIVVVDLDSRGRLTWFQSLGREAPTIALFALGLAVAGEDGTSNPLEGLWLIANFISVVARNDRRALHDLLAGTVCLRKEAVTTAAAIGAASFPFTQPAPGAPGLQPPPGFGETIVPPPLAPPAVPPASPPATNPWATGLEVPSFAVNYGSPSADRPYQNIWRRLGAAVVDRFIIGAATQVVSLAFATGGVAGALLTGAAMLAADAYPVVLVALRGQTLGKMAFGVKVVRASDLGPVSWARSLVRRLPTALIVTGTTAWLLIAIASSDLDFTDAEALEASIEEDGLPASIMLPAVALVLLNGGWYLANLLTALNTEKKQAVYDLLAGTVVIRAESNPADRDRFAPRQRTDIQPEANEQEPPPPRDPPGG